MEASTVAYGDGPEQVADLRLPAGQAPSAGWPTVVLLHGGFWRDGYRRDEVAPLADDLTARGYATWNVEYRRLGPTGGGVPATLEDVAAAVDHLVVVARSVPLDLGRTAVIGHSAGGQLALWVAGRGVLAAKAPGADPGVVPCVVIGLAPVADLVAGQELGGGAVADLLGHLPGAAPERTATVDPVQLVGHGVPVTLVHGEADEVVPVDQSRRYAAAARAAGDVVDVVVLPGDHLTVVDPRSPLWAATVDAIDAAC